MYGKRILLLALALAAVPLFILYLIMLIWIYALVQCHLLTFVHIPPFLGCSEFA